MTDQSPEDRAKIDRAMEELLPKNDAWRGIRKGLDLPKDMSIAEMCKQLDPGAADRFSQTLMSIGEVCKRLRRSIS